MYFKLIERLTKDADGYGSIDWRIELGAVGAVSHLKEFQETWRDPILASVREVVADGLMYLALRKLAESLDVPFST